VLGLALARMSMLFTLPCRHGRALSRYIENVGHSPLALRVTSASTTEASTGRISPHLPPFMFYECYYRLSSLLLQSLAHAAYITGVPKIRRGRPVQSGIAASGWAVSTRVGGSACLNKQGERWTCGVRRVDDLIKLSIPKLTFPPRQKRGPPLPHRGALRSDGR